MRYHKNLTAESLRRLPWRSQVGMIASELSRVRHLRESGGGPEIIGCLQRARELFGVLESSPRLPQEVAAVLAEFARELGQNRLANAPAKAGDFYQQLMALYRS